MRAFAYDPAQKVIGGGVIGGRFYNFDPASCAGRAKKSRGLNVDE